MSKKRLLIVLLTLLSLTAIPFAAQAATITACTFDRDTYKQGETGYIKITIFNDADSMMRVTELTATINYYYTDETIYLQKFFTDATLPVEIEEGNSSTFHIPLSLPTNIASGYTNVDVRAKTQTWSNILQRWMESNQPTYQPTLFIESPYKEQMEEQITINEQLEDQLDEQQTVNQQLEEQIEEQMVSNKNVTNMMYLLGVTTMVFAAMMTFLFILNRRMRIPTQSTP
jgi:hypothetical protein